MVFILYKLYVLLPYTYPTPKLSPHRRRCISIFPQKNSLCMIYKRFKLWGHWKCPHKSPSPCHTHVIIQICVLINHINMPTHTHTHTLSLTPVTEWLAVALSFQLLLSASVQNLINTSNADQVAEWFLCYIIKIWYAVSYCFLHTPARMTHLTLSWCLVTEEIKSLACWRESHVALFRPILTALNPWMMVSLIKKRQRLTNTGFWPW